MGDNARPILHTPRRYAQAPDDLSNALVRMPTKNDVGIRARQLELELIQLRAGAATSLPTMSQVKNSCRFRATTTRLALPLDTDEAAPPKILVANPKASTDLAANLTISMATYAALMVTAKPRPNLIAHWLEDLYSMMHRLSNDAPLMVHSVDIALRPHASLPAWIAVRNQITNVAHKNDASLRIILNLLNMAAKRCLVSINSSEMSVTDRPQPNGLGILSVKLFFNRDYSHYT
jgi:hypothetical protein